ncbi:MAG: flagellin FliC [Planctomycetes bacterium]|nr:flagellin FliC [Planctomycetota bacterium]MCB9909963.1 flagellin FliC [Planctomycetota bacterium]HPF13670.1 flagellin [Planctomycetota bacterium]HRV80893.1 flagellin [Planctomycetota bacterium]
MGLRINTNIASMSAQRNLSNVSGRLQGNYARLSSGLRIASAADDAAGLGISEKMRGQIRSYGVASRNAMDGLSLSQTAEGALGEVSNILGRMRELAMQSSNGTLSSEDRDTIQAEFTSLTDEIDRISGETKFNGVSLLDGSTATLNIQVGLNSGDTITLDLTDVSSATLGVDSGSLDVTTDTGAVAALAALDTAIGDVNTARGGLGADQNRMQSAIRSIQTVTENLSAAESRIRDVDVAFETADMTRNSIMQQAATSVLAQANAQPQIALNLLG